MIAECNKVISSKIFVCEGDISYLSSTPYSGSCTEVTTALLLSKVVIEDSAFSSVLLETLADSHVFVRHVATNSALPVKHLTIISAARLPDCILTATSLRLHAYTIGFQMKS
jgi:hypothetical protein